MIRSLARLTVVLVASVALVACGSDSKDAVTSSASTDSVEETTEQTTEPAPVYTMRFGAVRATAGGRLTVAGTTNLPDGTAIELTATRVFVNKGETEPRSARLATEQLQVDGGTFQTTTTLDESQVANFADTGFPVATVSPNVHVCATVYTGNDSDDAPRQSDDVSSVLGKSGDALATSPLAQEYGSATDTPSTMLELAKSIPAAPGDAVLEVQSAQNTTPRVAPLEGFCS